MTLPSQKIEPEEDNRTCRQCKDTYNYPDTVEAHGKAEHWMTDHCSRECTAQTIIERGDDL